ncbi:unnamed protein product [Alopecurus aequalis]
MRGGNNGPGVTEWPFLVGVPATPAVRKIKHDRPDVSVEVVGEGTPVPGGYNGKRVRVFYDTQEPDAPVTRIPVIG